MADEMNRHGRGKLPKIIIYDRPIMFYPDVAERIDRTIQLWEEVWEGNRFSSYRLGLLLVGEVNVEKDEARVVVSDFFTLPGWSWSSIEVDASLTSIGKIAQKYMVVATMVACPRGHPLSPVDVGLMLSVDAAVGRPIPHIIVAGGQKSIISFEKCGGIAELLKSLKANLERSEEIA